MRAVRAFAVTAVIEAISWLLLIVATVVKYTAGNALGVHILGPIHGVLFLAYVVLVFPTRAALNWSRRTTAVILVDSVLPGGGFLAARRVRGRTPESAGPSSSGSPRTAQRR